MSLAVKSLRENVDKYEPGCSVCVGVKGEAGSRTHTGAGAVQHAHRLRAKSEFARRLSTRTRRHIHRA